MCDQRLYHHNNKSQHPGPRYVRNSTHLSLCHVQFALELSRDLQRPVRDTTVAGKSCKNIVWKSKQTLPHINIFMWLQDWSKMAGGAASHTVKCTIGGPLNTDDDYATHGTHTCATESLGAHTAGNKWSCPLPTSFAFANTAAGCYASCA